MRPATRPAAGACLTAGLVALVSMPACTASDPVDGHADLQATGPEAQVVDEPIEPKWVFINLLPWGEVDFTRGEFPSLDDCNTFVRALPTYSGYTTAERCQRIDDPVYCTAWQDDGAEHIGCFKGVGGCEVGLKRHDLLAQSGARTIATRCEPLALDEAWALYQTAAQP